MLSKSKLAKLRNELRKLGFKPEQQESLTGLNHSALHRVYRGVQHNQDALIKLVGKRDELLAKAKKLEDAI